MNMIIIDIILVFLLLMATLEITGMKHYVARLADYWQGQFAVLIWILCLAKLLWTPAWNIFDTIMILGGFFFVIRALYRLFPYTFLAKKEVPDCDEGSNALKIVVSNLQYDNENYSRAQRLFQAYDADILFLLETTPQWKQQLTDIWREYPFQIVEQRDDAFGMIVLSRLEIKHEDVLRIYNDTPTMNFQARWKDQWIDCWCVHPKPPTPMDANDSIPKDKEFKKIGEIIADRKLPTVVAGDLNDVAWSRVTRKFLKETDLKDARVGRGLQISFPTYAPWLGFPLDQIFVSKEFGLVHMGKLPHIGSDHYPMTFSIAFLTSN